MKLLQRAVVLGATVISLVVLVPPALASASLSFSTKSLPNTNVASSYSKQIVVKGGTAPLTFSVTDGSLPPGLTLSSSGLVSGSATTPGKYTFTVSVADSSSPQQTSSQTYTVNVRILGQWTLCTYSSGSAGNGIDNVTLEQGGQLRDSDGATGTWSLSPANRLAINDFVFRNYRGSWDAANNEFAGTYAGPDSGVFAMVPGSNNGQNCVEPTA